MHLFPYYVAFLGTVSLITMGVFFLDKWKAARGAWRVPEIVLLTLMGMGGSVGGRAGMYFLRHKTALPEKYPFAVTVWLSLAVQLLGGAGLLSAGGGA